MKRRYLYMPLFGVPILLAATIVTAVVVGAAAGALWLFVAGDDPWPPFADTSLTALIVLVFAASSLALAYRAYVVGKRREGEAAVESAADADTAAAAVTTL